MIEAVNEGMINVEDGMNEGEMDVETNEDEYQMSSSRSDNLTNNEGIQIGKSKRKREESMEC